MGNSKPSSVVYQGEVLIADFDPENLDDLEEELAEFVELDPDEELFVSVSGGDTIEVRKLRDQTGRDSG